MPPPRLAGRMSVEEAILRRRSRRKFSVQPISLEELGQLLWAAQGITDGRTGFRAAPSAGATYPLIIYVVVGENGVVGLEAGVYRYVPKNHSLILVRIGDYRRELCVECLGQECVLTAPVSIVIAADYGRTTSVYGERGRLRYVPMEAGHASENVYLQAEALGLGTVAVGAFDDEGVRRIIGCSPEETPLYVMPVGKPV